MTPGARVSAAIECLDQIFAGSPAEKTLTRWARGSRFAGSKDRAAVRDHVFDALRKRDTCAFLGGALTGRSVMIGLCYLQGSDLEGVFSGQGHAPDPLTAVEIDTVQSNQAALNGDEDASKSNALWNMQGWCKEALKVSHDDKSFEIADLLSARAPVDLRTNLIKGSVEDAISTLAEDDILVEPSDLSETALRVLNNPRKVKTSRAYESGLVELQDAGSQALVDALPIPEVGSILDFCAGGGGKSLALAAKTSAFIYAHDVDVKRMQDIPIRAKRAGADIKCLDGDRVLANAPFDLVLCDAPCSGSGAWRRSPDAKWRTTQSEFENLLSLQACILDEANAFVRSNGYLCYATCSLFAQENEDQVNKFLEDRTDFKLILQKLWTPLNGSDGFYVAVLQSLR